MTVRLEKNVKRFIGSSADPKPRPGQRLLDPTSDDLPPILTDADVPIGSTFLEEDVYLSDGTQRIARWDGGNWVYPQAAANETPTAAIVKSLDAVFTELNLLRIGMIAAGACKDVS